MPSPSDTTEGVTPKETLVGNSNVPVRYGTAFTIPSLELLILEGYIKFYDRWSVLPGWVHHMRG